MVPTNGSHVVGLSVLTLKSGPSNTTGSFGVLSGVLIRGAHVLGPAVVVNRDCRSHDFENQLPYDGGAWTPEITDETTSLSVTRSLGLGKSSGSVAVTATSSHPFHYD